MKNKGFTLIELLAVIVILAIIAVIAVPIVLNIINDSLTSSYEKSIELYGKAVEQSVSSKEMIEEIIPGFYTTTDGRTLTNIKTGDIINIKYNGNDVVCDEISITEHAEVYVSKCKIKGKIVKGSYGHIDYLKYTNGQVVYFDVATGTGCNNYVEENSSTNYNGIDNKFLNQNSCLKFYAFNDDGGSKVNLLLDHNTTASTTWSSYNNTTGPENLLKKLNSDTKNWNGTEKTVSYTDDIITKTINYDNYKARLITVEEIMKITNNENWKKSYNFYFDTGDSSASSLCTWGSVTGCEYRWLYDRTNQECLRIGCLNNSDEATEGYWTASAGTNVWDAYHVWYTAGLGSTGVTYSGFGVRPVIEVLKSRL